MARQKKVPPEPTRPARDRDDPDEELDDGGDLFSEEPDESVEQPPAPDLAVRPAVRPAATQPAVKPAVYGPAVRPPPMKTWR